MPLRLTLVGILLLTALGLGLVGYHATRPPTTITLTAAPEALPPPLTVDVLVAAHNLPAGTLMKEEDFTRRAVSPAEILLLHQRARGKVVRSDQHVDGERRRQCFGGSRERDRRWRSRGVIADQAKPQGGEQEDADQGKTQRHGSCAPDVKQN